MQSNISACKKTPTNSWCRKWLISINCPSNSNVQKRAHILSAVRECSYAINNLRCCYTVMHLTLSYYCVHWRLFLFLFPQTCHTRQMRRHFRARPRAASPHYFGGKASEWEALVFISLHRKSADWQVDAIFEEMIYSRCGFALDSSGTCPLEDSEAFSAAGPKILHY